MKTFLHAGVCMYTGVCAEYFVLGNMGKKIKEALNANVRAICSC